MLLFDYFLFQFRYALIQPGKIAYVDCLSGKIAIFHSRIAHDTSAILRVFIYARLCANLHIVTDMQMSCKSYLATYHAATAQFGRAGDT